MGFQFGFQIWDLSFRLALQPLCGPCGSARDFISFHRADLEAQVFDLLVGREFDQPVKHGLFLKRQLLQQDGIRDEDFEHTAFDLADAAVFGDQFPGCGVPRGRQFGRGPLPRVAPLGEEPREDFGDGLRSAHVKKQNVISPRSHGEHGGKAKESER